MLNCLCITWPVGFKRLRQFTTLSVLTRLRARGSAVRFLFTQHIQQYCDLEMGRVLSYLEQSRCLGSCYHNIILQHSVFHYIESVNAICCLCGFRTLGTAVARDMQDWGISCQPLMCPVKLSFTQGEDKTRRGSQRRCIKEERSRNWTNCATVRQETLKMRILGI